MKDEVDYDVATPVVGDGPVKQRRPGHVVRQVLFAVWLGGVLVTGAFLLAGHLLTLPKPALENPTLQHALAATRAPGEEGRFRVLHVLYADCRCSQRVLEHLLSRRAEPGLVEQILFVGEGSRQKEQALAAGYKYESTTEAELASRYAIEAAPLLVIVDGADHVRYVGGYTDRKQGVVIHDVDIEKRVERGETVAAMPVFGCAVSRGLKDTVDPLGLH